MESTVTYRQKKVHIYIFSDNDKNDIYKTYYYSDHKRNCFQSQIYIYGRCIYFIGIHFFYQYAAINKHDY